MEREQRSRARVATGGVLFVATIAWTAFLIALVWLTIRTLA